MFSGSKVSWFLQEGEDRKNPACVWLVLTAKAPSLPALPTESLVHTCPSQTISSKGAPINLENDKVTQKQKAEVSEIQPILVNKQDSEIYINQGAKVI